MGTNPDGSKGSSGLKVADNYNYCDDNYFIDLSVCDYKEAIHFAHKMAYPFGITNQGFMALMPL